MYFLKASDRQRPSCCIKVSGTPFALAVVAAPIRKECGLILLQPKDETKPANLTENSDLVMGVRSGRQKRGPACRPRTERYACRIETGQRGEFLYAGTTITKGDRPVLRSKCRSESWKAGMPGLTVKKDKSEKVMGDSAEEVRAVNSPMRKKQ